VNQNQQRVKCKVLTDSGQTLESEVLTDRGQRLEDSSGYSDNETRADTVRSTDRQWTQ
jgi:hypothetical protein